MQMLRLFLLFEMRGQPKLALDLERSKKHRGTVGLSDSFSGFKFIEGSLKDFLVTASK